MAYPYTPNLIYPIKYWIRTKKKFGFGKIYSYSDKKGKRIKWGKHLGEDADKRAGMPVVAIGRGRVVLSAIYPGKDKSHRNWGNIIIIAHKSPKTKKPFYSLYAHLGNRLVLKGDPIWTGRKIGEVGKGLTRENGWWEDAHLHFGIYTGPWKGVVLPGYNKTNREEGKIKYWRKPTDFIRNYE